jgi:collagen type IV alpha
MMSLLL